MTPRPEVTGVAALAIPLATLLFASCAKDGAAADAASMPPDGALVDDSDSRSRDSDDGGDTFSVDAFVPRPGFGALSGACGVLDDEEWTTDDPFIFRNAIDFGSQVFDTSLLSGGGKQIASAGNLNDGSLLSEIFAYEVLYRCEGAELVETEKTISYQDVDGKKTDLLVEIDGRPVGVSVTRAYHYPASDHYTEAEAAALLSDKLTDVIASADNAKAPDRWQRSMLHVIAYDDGYADAVMTAYSALAPALKASTLVVVTVTHGEDELIY